MVKTKTKRRSRKVTAPETIQEKKEEAFELLDEVEQAELSDFEQWKRDKQKERDERIPGKKVAGTKTMWTKKDIADRWPVVTFVPEETVKVTFQGVIYQLLAGAENHVPQVIRDQYYMCKRQERMAGKSLPETGYVTTIDLGAGALPPE